MSQGPAKGIVYAPHVAKRADSDKFSLAKGGRSPVWTPRSSATGQGHIASEDPETIHEPRQEGAEVATLEDDIVDKF